MNQSRIVRNKFVFLLNQYNNFENRLKASPKSAPTLPGQLQKQQIITCRIK